MTYLNPEYLAKIEDIKNENNPFEKMRKIVNFLNWQKEKLEKERIEAEKEYEEERKAGAVYHSPYPHPYISTIRRIAKELDKINKKLKILEECQKEELTRFNRLIEYLTEN